MLKILANENIPRLLIATLRDNGHDVDWVREDRRGIADPQVLSEAVRDNRILLTCDKDFGELVFRQGRSASCGIVLIRLASVSQSDLVRLASFVLDRDQAHWTGHFSVIGPTRVRRIPLPD